MATGSFNLPVGSSIIKKESYLEFPSIGNSNSLYIDLSESSLYHWDGKLLKYYKIGQNYDGINLINGGDANGG